LGVRQGRDTGRSDLLHHSPVTKEYVGRGRRPKRRAFKASKLSELSDATLAKMIHRVAVPLLAAKRVNPTPTNKLLGSRSLDQYMTGEQVFRVVIGGGTSGFAQWSGSNRFA